MAPCVLCAQCVCLFIFFVRSFWAPYSCIDQQVCALQCTRHTSCCGHCHNAMHSIEIFLSFSVDMIFSLILSFFSLSLSSFYDYFMCFLRCVYVVLLPINLALAIPGEGARRSMGFRVRARSYNFWYAWTSFVLDILFDGVYLFFRSCASQWPSFQTVVRTNGYRCLRHAYGQWLALFLLVKIHSSSMAVVVCTYLARLLLLLLW